MSIPQSHEESKMKIIGTKYCYYQKVFYHSSKPSLCLAFDWKLQLGWAKEISDIEDDSAMSLRVGDNFMYQRPIVCT
jgi:hypothetical protein